MKITLESTSQLVYVGDIQARVWVGQTENGIKIQAVIPRVAVHEGEDQTQFQKELAETSPPISQPLVFPLRMLL